MTYMAKGGGGGGRGGGQGRGRGKAMDHRKLQSRCAPGGQVRHAHSQHSQHVQDTGMADTGRQCYKEAEHGMVCVSAPSLSWQAACNMLS